MIKATCGGSTVRILNSHAGQHEQKAFVSGRFVVFGFFLNLPERILPELDLLPGVKIIINTRLN